jgi:AcrR family transcriptional regulator
MPRPTLSDDEIRRQRDRALEVALRTVGRQGLEAVTMRSIANGVGLSPMALYRYFPGGRSEVLTTIRGSGFEQLSERFESALAEHRDPIDQILALTGALIAFARGHPQLYQLMFNLTQPEEGEAYLATRRGRAWKLAAGPFQAAIRAGAIRADADVFPHIVFAAVHGAILFELSEQPHAPRRLHRLIGPLLETLFVGGRADPAVIRKVRRVFGGRKRAPLDDKETT